METHSIIEIHEVLILTYLKFSKKPVGMLFNFTVKGLKHGISRFIMKH